ncbi:MAG: hypothetical protein Q8N26_36500 [Myxococcales bacterium]|nr:hypothetical protein [Myxococcales bacterium]
MAPRRLTLVLFALSGCLTPKVTSVQRAMLAPLPPPPLLNFDTGHGGQVSLSGQLHPFTAPQGSTSSGVGVPSVQGSLSPMIRISRKFAFGGAVQVISGDRAHYANAQSGLVASPTAGFGVVVATHFTTFELGGFGLDGAAQLSLHGLPVSIGAAPGPLSTTPSSSFANTSTPVPGLALMVLPRFTGRYGTLYAGLGVHTNADIDARGIRVTGSGRVLADDVGGLRALLGQAGVGYSVTFPFGGGLSVQAFVPIGAGRFGYLPTFTVSLHGAFGAPPPVRGPPPPAGVAPRRLELLPPPLPL